MELIEKSTDKLNCLFDAAAERFEGRAAVRFQNVGSSAEVLLYGQLHRLSTSIAEMISRHNVSHEVVGFTCKPSLTLPAILIGILKADKAFCAQCSPKTRTMHFRVDYVVSYAGETNFGDIVDQIETDFGEIRLVKLKENSLPSPKRIRVETVASVCPLAYVVHTSGTTGTPKSIKVPHRCIVPNIIHLSQIFGLVETDVISLLSPMTFDPSIVEVFLALTCGATLLIVPDVVRIVPKMLSRYLMDNGVTVIQATPSLIQRIGQERLQNEILAAESSVRILALGGETCPNTHTLRRWKAKQNQTLIFNLYGTTEVSCWASYNLVSLHQMDSSDGPVPLGNPLSETLLEVRNSVGQVVEKGKGQLFVGSRTRFCFLDNEADRTNSVVWRATGDWVDVQGGQLFFSGRQDDVVKYNGKKVNLDMVRMATSSVEFIDSFFLHFNGQVLNVFVVPKGSVSVPFSDRTVDIVNRLTGMCESLPPVKVFSVPYLPVTTHGKIDNAKLVSLSTEQSRSRLGGSPVDILRDIWCSQLGVSSVQLEDNFVLCGGNSVTAVQMGMEIEFHFGKSFQTVVDVILNSTFENLLQLTVSRSDLEHNHTIERTLAQKQSRIQIKPNSNDERSSFILKHLKTVSISNCFSCFFRSLASSCCTCGQCKDTLESGAFSAVRVHWKFNLFKCVDSSPLLVSYRGGSTVVFAGSHHGTLAAVDYRDGSAFWTTRLPDRLESSPCLSSCGRYVLIGCYDSCLYCFCVASGCCHWSFRTGSEVKSSPVCLGSVVFCGSHDGHLYAVETESGSLCWSTRVGGGSVFSSPSVCRQPPRVYCASLDGVIAAMCPEKGHVTWTRSCLKPIFASPLVNARGVCVGCVDGLLTFFDHDGARLWSYDSGSAIFCSPSQGDVGVLCANHGGRVFCLDADSGVLIWDHAMGSAVYSRICRSSSAVCAIATDGSVDVVDARSGQKSFAFSMEGHVFSSPVIFGRALLVGCRDNYLYCYDLL